jgi:putative membrane protein insertion efficiency factor
MMSSGNTGRVSSGFADGNRSGLAERLLLLAVEAYRVTLSPLLGGHCRFEPSCSRYAEEALRRHGAATGSRLALGRLLRCHPFRPGGYDPVP